MSKEYDPIMDIDNILEEFSQSGDFTGAEEEPVKVYTPADAKTVSKSSKAEARQKPEQRPPLFSVPARFRKLIPIVFSLISVFAMFWMLFNVHPAAGPVASATGADNRLNLINRLEQFMNNAASDALGDLAYIKKIYTIEESATVAPPPHKSCYGSTTDPTEIQAVIDQASELLEGQEMAWDPNADFFPGSQINYYYDETILVIAWKEIIDGKVCTCAEVKIAHGSQLRRKIAEDTYGSSVQMKASDMAQQSNSVIAINGDFYAFRTLGITGYQGTIYRCAPETVDSCFFTRDGDMIFSYAGHVTSWEEAQSIMDENNCGFAIAFGPVLIDDGELLKIDRYPIGEVHMTYSRAAIGMLDKLHYMLMTVNYEVGFDTTATIHQLGKFMYSKGCTDAYTLDGGQTSVMVMQGETLNSVDWGIEREMSDIIYFATALPAEEVA